MLHEKKIKMKIVQNESRPIPSLPYEIRRLCLKSRRQSSFRTYIRKMESVLLQGPRRRVRRHESDDSFWGTPGFYDICVEIRGKHLSWTVSDDGRMFFSIDFATMYRYK